ncbi:hypothetical protein EMIHUDRAFT_458856, partial [Emiliania huxleyi CCMP1516]|uniref:non-specific serine/threonine protein kinase n=2 Tax=Emiliania huxleyi TaxID=2903 RepID=A0A0D3J624_EMIH1
MCAALPASICLSSSSSAVGSASNSRKSFSMEALPARHRPVASPPAAAPLRPASFSTIGELRAAAAVVRRPPSREGAGGDGSLSPARPLSREGQRVDSLGVAWPAASSQSQADLLFRMSGLGQVQEFVEGGSLLHALGPKPPSTQPPSRTPDSSSPGPDFNPVDDHEASDFVERRVLGQGAFGHAVLWESRRNGLLVVAKKLLIAGTTDFRKLENEVAICASLRHPNIVQYLRTSHNDTYLVLMQVLHRDLSASNVFLSAAGDIKVGDFGLSKTTGVNASRSALATTMCGTPNYCSPELINGEPYGAASDVWAIGLIAYQLFTLRHPFEASSVSQLFRLICAGKVDTAAL